MFASRRVLLVAVFLLVLAVYLALPTKLYYWDGIAYSLEIENLGKFRPTLTHPNHLVFGPAGYYWYALLHSVWPGIRAHDALQSMSSILGAGAAAFFCGLLLALGASSYLAASLSLLLAFSATWWRFSTDANAYVASVFFLVASAWVIVAAGRARPVLLAATHTAAMLFHQLAVLFFPAGLVGLWLAGARSEARSAAADTPGELPRQSPPNAGRNIRALVIYCAGTVPVTLGCYYYGFYLNERTLHPGRFPAWITFHSPDSHFTFNPFADFARTAASHVRLFFGGRLSALAVYGTAARVAAMLALGALVVAFVWQSARSHHRDPENAEPHRENSAWSLRSLGLCVDRLRLASVVGAAWSACYLAFLFVWLPQNTFYRLFYLPGLLLLAGVAGIVVERGSGARRYRLALAVAFVALFNFVFFIYPNSRVEANPPLALAREMQADWPPRTVIYYAALSADDWILMYEHPQTSWVPLAGPNLPELERGLRQIRGEGRTAWAETTALDLIAGSPGGHDWLVVHTRPERARELVNTRQRIRLAELFP
jgi:hypothetical protein